jgi:hypothetical protein
MKINSLTISTSIDAFSDPAVMVSETHYFGCAMDHRKKVGTQRRGRHSVRDALAWKSRDQERLRPNNGAHAVTSPANPIYEIACSCFKMFAGLLLPSTMLLAGSFSAHSQQIEQNDGDTSPIEITKVVAQTPYSVTARDGDQKIWSKITWESNSVTGLLVTKTNSYVELATASAHFANGQWIDSSDQIQITETGAQATNSQHKVEFLGNINSAGAIRITLPEGDKHLISTPIALSYFDTASGKSVLIAELKDSVGQLLPSGNQVLYPDAFTDFSADLLYINMISGFEQLIVLRQQPPSPAEWGLNPKTTLLQVITEFLNPPAPQITRRSVGGLTDEHLDFGVTQMPRGYAFALGDETNTIPVTKQWLVLDGRQCLIESTPFDLLTPLLKELPPAPRQAFHLSPDSEIRKVAGRHLLPTRRLARKEIGSLLLASSVPLTKGVAIDYATASSQTNFTFQADTTYYISSNVTFSGTTVLEGGTVIKFTNSAAAKLSISGSGVLLCKTGPYRMAILTSKDDNTVGETITGSTGVPTNSGTIYLDGPDGYTTYQYLRLSYAGTAIHAYSPLEVKHCQFLRCGTGVAGDDSTELKVRNVLFSVCETAVSIGGGTSLLGEHVTADQVTKFFDAPNCTCKLTNSILTAVTNIGTNVSLYFCATNSSGNGIYQVVGAASYYLADSSTNRNAGSTSINTNLVKDLKSLTTYPPQLLTNTITSNIILNATVALRDSDTPDRGYHYAPLDYVATGRTVTNTLTLTNGAALGIYGSVSGYGVYLASAGTLVSSGTPNNLNAIVRYNTTQEQSNTNWSSSSIGPSVKTDSANARAQCRFTGWSIPAGSGDHFISTVTGSNHFFMDCQFTGGKFTIDPGLVSLTNCLLERVILTLRDNGENNRWYLFNNLLKGSLVYKAIGSSPVALAYDNLFDGTTISKQSGSDDFTHNFNSYITNKSRLSPNGANDKILTNTPTYLTSYLGNYYYPTNDGLLSTLINAGSRNATNSLLFHHCTITNQVKEANSTVDIGFHYIATDASGNPIDTDGAGTPDYLADTNGNGFQEFGEFAFGITVDNPANGSVLLK